MKLTKIFIFLLILLVGLVGANFYSRSQTKKGLQVIYNCEKDKSVFDVLVKSVANVESEDSTLGKFVTSIDGHEQGGGKYWLYTVNGQEATVSASQYICQDNEEVIWELK